MRAYIGKDQSGKWHVLDHDEKPLSCGFLLRGNAVAYAVALGLDPWFRNPIWTIDELFVGGPITSRWVLLRGIVELATTTDAARAVRFLQRGALGAGEWAILYALELSRPDRRVSVVRYLEEIKP